LEAARPQKGVWRLSDEKYPFGTGIQKPVPKRAEAARELVQIASLELVEARGKSTEKSPQNPMQKPKPKNFVKSSVESTHL